MRNKTEKHRQQQQQRRINLAFAIHIKRTSEWMCTAEISRRWDRDWWRVRVDVGEWARGNEMKISEKDRSTWAHLASGSAEKETKRAARWFLFDSVAVCLFANGYIGGAARDGVAEAEKCDKWQWSAGGDVDESLYARQIHLNDLFWNLIRAWNQFAPYFFRIDFQASHFTFYSALFALSIRCAVIASSFDPFQRFNTPA